MNHIHIIFLLLLAATQFHCSSNDTTRERRQELPRFDNSNAKFDTRSDSYVIIKGDEVSIAVWGYSEFNTTTTVKEAGTIAVPLIGELRVEGLTIEQLKSLLNQRLAEYIQGEIKLTITVGSSVGQKINVLGSVSRQENYSVKTEMSLLEVLSLAGGTTPDSDLRHVKIYPNSNTEHPIEVDLTWYMENGNIRRIPKVRPGDTVFVPKKENFLRDVSDFSRDLIYLLGFFRLFN